MPREGVVDILTERFMKNQSILGVAVFLALAARMAVADWTASDQNDNTYVTLTAGGVTGPVGCLAGAGPDDNGVLVVTFGSDVNGSIGPTPSADTKTHANSPVITQTWSGANRQQAESCTFTVDQVVLGYGQSTLLNGDAYLASAYSVELHSVTTLPVGTGPGGHLLSDNESLVGASTYWPNVPAERWTTSITVPPMVNTVTGTATTISQASVYGWDCALQSRLTLTLVLDLSTPAH